MIPKIIPPTDAEDAAINRGIAADPDTFELPVEHYKNARPLSALIKNGVAPPEIVHFDRIVCVIASRQS